MVALGSTLKDKAAVVESLALREARQKAHEAGDELRKQELLESDAHALLQRLEDHFGRFLTNNKHCEIPENTRMGTFWRAKELFHMKNPEYRAALDLGWLTPAVLFEKRNK